MIAVHLYGHFRKMVPGSKADEDTILRVEPKSDETFHEFICRLGLDDSRIGDCFINGRLAHNSDIVKDYDRIGLVLYNMKLIDGGMGLKFSPYRR